jgi:Tfp pilus assembly protein PilN
MNLDFSAQTSRPGGLSWLLLVVGLAISFWVMQGWQVANARFGAAESRLANLQTKPAQHLADKVAKAKRADSAGQNRQRSEDAARSQLALPWPRLLETLQRKHSPDIALLSLDADGRRGDFTLTAFAKNHAAMLDYFEQLQREPGLLQVSLSRHELREVDAEKRVYFSLGGLWAQP